MPPISSPRPRLHSLDALRGFTMIWIMGLDQIVILSAKLTGWQWLNVAAKQMDHAEWNGLHFYDLIFPTFLFVAGASIPFSVLTQLERGVLKGAIYRGLFVRFASLVALGLVYNGLLQNGFAELRCASVLARIGAGYLGAALIVMHHRIRGQLLWLLGILVGYWMLLRWVPVPGGVAGHLSANGNLVAYIDRHFLPGVLYNKTNDPEGLLSALPSVATGLLGAMAGQWLRRGREQMGATKLPLLLALGGFLALVAGLAWHPWFPINKNLWTSSFVLAAAGWSALALALFYWVIDVRGLVTWSKPLRVIGRNSITVYVGSQIIEPWTIGANLFGWLYAFVAVPWQPVANIAGSIGVALTILWWMDMKGWHFKV